MKLRNFNTQSTTLKTFLNKYDIIVEDYVNKVDFVRNHAEKLESSKLGFDDLNRETLELKRIVRNSELKFRKYLGITDEEWEKFSELAPNLDNIQNQKPLSYSNEKIVQHINMTNYLRKSVLSKLEMLNIYKYSTEQYSIFSERHQSGNPSPEEIQKERLLVLLKSINDSLLKESETMKEFVGMAAPDANMTGRGLNLNLANKRLSFLNPLIKHFEANNQSNQIKLPGENDSSDEDGGK